MFRVRKEYIAAHTHLTEGKEVDGSSQSELYGSTCAMGHPLLVLRLEDSGVDQVAGLT